MMTEVRGESPHGSFPDTSTMALLLIDVISDFDFPDGEALVREAEPAARRSAELKRRARAAGVPAIYVNDNLGRWRSDFRQVVERCLRPGARGRSITQLLLPEEEDYFVLKPKHSGFFGTTLEILLQYLGVSKLVLTGFTAESCVLFTANDAHMRGMEVLVPEDCVASARPADRDQALALLRRVVSADTRPSPQIRFPQASHGNG